MNGMLKYIKGDRKEAVLGPLLKLVEATLELIVPLIIAKIIDNGILASDRPYVVKMALLLVLLGALGLACAVIAQYFAAKASVNYVARMRYDLFRHLGTLSYSDIDTLGTSTMITRMTSDSNLVQNGLNLGFRLLLRSPFVVFGAMIMAFTIDVKSAVTFAVVIPALAVVVFGIMLISMSLFKKVQTKVDTVVTKTRENLTGVRVIRAFTREKEELSEFSEKNNSLASSQKFAGKISALTNPLTFVLINLAIVWLIDIGALQVSLGKLSQGEVIALYNYMSQILIELIKLANLIIAITKSLASVARIKAVFEIKPSQTYGNMSEGVFSEYAVELSGAALTYKNASEPSIMNVTFKAKKGDTVGIIGGTGSGKTSLINLIARFYDATEGSVFIDGSDVKNYTADALRKKIGIVPQKAVLFSGSIRDNMLWGNKNASDEDIYRALELAQVKSVVVDKGGLDAPVSEGGANLSGGQKQRLTIARALVGRPEILILDDSASALDFATDAALRSAIKNSLGDTTVFIVSQRASSIMHADKIIVLEDGEVASMGTHAELLLTSPIYKEIYTSQFEEEAGI